jgi:hypothetical protein
MGSLKNMTEPKNKKEIIKFLNRDNLREYLNQDAAREELSKKEEGENKDEQRNDNK